MMYSIVKGIQELDVYSHLSKGPCNMISHRNTAIMDTDSRQTTGEGCESRTNCLMVQSKTMENFSNRPNPSRSKLLPRLCTTNLPNRPSGHLQSITSTADLKPPTGMDSDSPAQHHSKYHQNSGIDSCFIQTVTVTEVVCGKERYKCSGCLCYYTDLGSLMSHIEQGWREGYSCRVFYRKLRSIQDCRELLTVYEKEAASKRDPRHSASSHVVSALKQSTRDGKLRMVLRWLQESEITTELQ